MIKVLTIIGIFIVVIAMGYNGQKVIIKDWDDPMIKTEDTIMEQKYQGPVPDGYSIEHFRNTGNTILEEDIDGKV